MVKLCDVLDLSSTSSVFALVGRLVEAGYLDQVECRIAPTRRFFARPVVNTVRAGVPQPTCDDLVDFISIDDYLVEDLNRNVLCRVRGDSVRDASLQDGDMVVVEKNSATKPCDSDVAIVDEEFTVKTLRLDAQGRYYLQSANPAFPAIRPANSLEIFGVVVGSFRRYRH